MFGGWILFTGIKGNDSGNSNLTIVLVAGIVTLLIGICGCFGAILKSKKVLIAYSIFLLGLIISQSVIGGFQLVNSGNEDYIQEESSSFWDSLSTDNRKEFQKINSCCGYSGIIDRPASNCLVGITQACKPFVESFMKNLIIFAAVALFIAAGCELATIAISLILAFGEKQRLDFKMER